jgi:hypothetical protein
MDDATVKVTLGVTWKQIEDVLCCAWEGGASYWLSCHGSRPPAAPKDRAKVQFRFQNALYPGGACLVRVDGGADELELTRDKLIAGLQVLADRYPTHLVAIRNDQSDGDTGDAFLQCCLLGEIVYG